MSENTELGRWSVITGLCENLPRQMIADVREQKERYAIRLDEDGMSAPLLTGS